MSHEKFEFKVGDIVSFAGCIGKVTDIIEGDFELECKFEGYAHFILFEKDGRFLDWHKEPLLKFVERPAPKSEVKHCNSAHNWVPLKEQSFYREGYDYIGMYCVNCNSIKFNREKSDHSKPPSDQL